SSCSSSGARSCSSTSSCDAGAPRPNRLRAPIGRRETRSVSGCAGARRVGHVAVGAAGAHRGALAVLAARALRVHPAAAGHGILADVLGAWDEEFVAAVHVRVAAAGREVARVLPEIVAGTGASAEDRRARLIGALEAHDAIAA